MKTVLVGVLAAAAALTVAPPASADIVSFVSPSGNIACMTDMTEVRCDIRERSWSPPPKPADCPEFTGWGQGITLSETGGPQFVCAGDTVLGDTTAYVLNYGERHSLPGYACGSGPAGVTCTNQENHGFTISREAYRFF